jgi:transcriptional regulator with XRE-family HTH domain
MTPPRTRAAYYRRISKALGLPIAAVAHLSGYSVSYISAIENRTRPIPPHVEDVLRIVYDGELRRVYAAAAAREEAA